jgi:CheY-like chemotaxis protein
VTLLKGGLTKYRALVTDINLRGTMGGWEVAKRAREIDPEFPIIYMTGASADEYASRGVPNSILSRSRQPSLSPPFPNFSIAVRRQRKAA